MKGQIILTPARTGILGSLAAALLVAGAGVVRADDFTYATNSDNTITITHYIGSGGAVAIPGAINGLPVTIVGAFAFNNCANVTSVVIPNTVTLIRDDAFNTCNSLSSVLVGNGVTYIGGWGGFVYCHNLTSVFFTGNSPALGSDTFYSDPATIYYSVGTTGWGTTFDGRPTAMRTNQLTMVASPPLGGAVWVSGIYAAGANVQISASAFNGWAFAGWNDGTTNNPYNVTVSATNITYIADFIFQCAYRTNSDNTITITRYTGCGGAVTIPDTINGLSVGSIGTNAFYSSSLTGVTIPNSVTNIGASAFESCSNLVSAMIGTNVASIGNSAFLGDGLLTNLTVPNSVTGIGDRAFSGCASLTSVMIPTGVTSVGNYVFSSCTNLAGAYFLGNAPSFISIPIGATNPIVYYLPGTAGWSTNFDGLPTAIWNLFAYTTNSDNTIAIAGFNQSPPLGGITIPGSINGLPVTSIGNYAFSEDDGPFFLTSVTLPNGITNIGTSAFDSCGILTDINIPDGVTHIGNYAFYYCFKLTGIAIPGSVTSIGLEAFYSCDSLMAITVSASNPTYSSADGCLFNKGQTTLIQCPSGKAGSITVPGTVTNIGDWAFCYCVNLTNITISTGVTSVGAGAFYGCSGLTSVTIPDAVTDIGRYAFCDCANLTSVIIGTGLTSIGDEAFSDCTGLTGIYFKGNPPGLSGINVFALSPPTMHYLPGNTNWGATLGGHPASLWLPRLSEDSIHSNQFSFNINWASGMVCVVEACTNLTASSWHPLQTNALPADSSYFSDPDWTNNSRCFYRVIWR